ncbi:MAG: CDP-alcohol phosphatidyltransferase family protein [Ruminococcaceae bacterium]|nr:CDP-alcohol phosphatidyltransferase family protein [Oscillospiraceae bacterium]
MLPNILTTVRLIIIPLFAYSVLCGDNLVLSAVLFLFSGITDIVDGWIARRFNMITDVGKVYDPLVDKLMQITAVICLAVIDVIPVWVILVVIVKELTMIVMGCILYAKKMVVHSNWYGKAATVFFYAVIVILISFPEIGETAKNTLLGVLIGVLILAAIGYLGKFLGDGRKEICDDNR